MLKNKYRQANRLSHLDRRRWGRRIACLFLVAVALQAAPTIRDIQPRGAQRGKTFTLYVRGDGLTQGAQIKSTLPASFSQLTLSKDPLSDQGAARPGTVLPYLVALKADTPIGFYPIRVSTGDGISNVVLFSVGDLPEVEEIESKNPKQPNNLPAEAEKVQVPAVINGTLVGPDIDNYTFTAKAGQKLVFEVEARRAGSAIDPAIEIYDSAGRELARNDDAPGLGVDSRVEVTFPKSGDYRVRIHDSKFSDQAANFYRLKIGSYPYADAIFPLGWQRGGTTEVTLLGGNLAHPVKTAVDLNTKSGFAFVRLPGSMSPPFLFAVSDNPETIRPDGEAPLSLTEDTIVNGRISKAGEIDRYKLAVEPGQKWVFEVAAASLGTSQLDAILTLYDAAGKKLVAGDDGNGLDPVLPFTIPGGVKELTIAVEDLLGRGGNMFAYQLKAKQQEPDFSVDLATPFVNVPLSGTATVVCVVQRRGYDGALRLTIPNLPEGFHVAGGHVPPESAAQLFNNDNAGRRTAVSTLTITSDSTAKPQSVELSVIAEAVTPNGSIRRMARGPGMIVAVKGDKQKPFTAAWLDMKLPMATTTALPVSLEVPTPQVRISQGFEYALDYRVKRKEGGKVTGRVAQQIAGAVSNLRVIRGLENNKNPDAGSVLISTTFATPVTTFDMIVSAPAEIDGKPVTVFAPALEIEVAPGYQIQLSSSTMEIAPGGKMEVTGTVRRELTFEGGEIHIHAEDLPEQVKCPAVLVPADKQDFVLSCEAVPGAKAGSFPIRIASNAPETGRKNKADYKIADLTAKLVVGETTLKAVALGR
jgi:hypothetical protein